MVRIVRHWHKWHWEDMASPSVEVFKDRLDWHLLGMAWGECTIASAKWPGLECSMRPFPSYHAVILC